ncbi:unnamed protein product [Auanema sp. JU1783]|nr:unnamed protein product [Auanema sp. JU1783]
MTEVQPVNINYSNHFWGDKNHGFQILYYNLKKGEDAINEVAQFVKERLTVEEEYTKLLNRTVNRVGSVLSNGSSIDTAWSLTKSTFEILLDVQTMMVKNLQDLSREVAKYKEELNKNRKEIKNQTIVDAVNLMQTTTTCLQKAKETYQARSSELDKLKKESNLNVKEINKAETKLLKARDEYRAYIDKYEVVRIDFEEKMTRACEVFQDHDKTNYRTLHRFLEQYAAHHQEAFCSAQQLCGQLRESLQQINIEEILLQFATEKGTGTERPMPIAPEELEALESLQVSVNVSAPSVSVTNPNAIQSNPVPPSTASNDSLTLGDLENWGGAEKKATTQNSPTDSQNSDSTVGAPTSIFSSSLGGNGQKKLSMFLPKRKKTVSQSSIGEETETTGGFFPDEFNLYSNVKGLFKFRQNRRSKKSTTDLTAVDRAEALGMEDAHSTASSSKSDDKHQNGSISLLDTPVVNKPKVDDEGFSIPHIENTDKEDTNWSSCSSDEDENEMQQSKIRAITIKPADSVSTMNASVDELRDAIGHISIGRSNTFDKDPWGTFGGNKPPVFSQSLSGGSLKPLRQAHTGDGRFRSNFSESEFSRSNVPLNFSASCGPVAGMARARPRSNTPTHNSSFALSSQPSLSNFNKEANESQDWGSSFTINNTGSQHSLGESYFNLSQSTANLMQATISEQRVPIAMAINEYAHVWFKGAETSDKTQRNFGTVMISFAVSSLALLTDMHNDIEPLQFSLNNASGIKAILPNKQLLLPPSTAIVPDATSYLYTFDKLGLANWLLSQQKEKPKSPFFNAEVLRYELHEKPEGNDPPLFLTAYWKCEDKHTDLRIDYRLNEDSINTLLNVSFKTKINAKVSNLNSDPTASWNSDTSELVWSITELSKHGECSGSLKARIHLHDGEKTTPGQTHAQFNGAEIISGVNVALESSDTYHLSMIRKKLLAGKYFCEPEIRK